MAAEYHIRIGAMGWEHPAWTEIFYPQDLPEDWQLVFYGNEFPVAGVPARIWLGDTETLIETWLDNLHEHFRLVFEHRWTDGETLQGFIAQLRPMSEYSLGILLQIRWDEVLNNTELTAILENLGGNTPVCLEIMGDNGHPRVEGPDFTNPELDELLQKYRLGVCWHGCEPNAEKFFRYAQLALTRIKESGLKGRALRQVLETCSAAVQPENTMVLLFDGAPPDINSMRDAMIMLDLIA